MSNYLLKPVFKSVFDCEFNKSEFTDRLKMQKAIYLLQNLGISVGEYNFLWYKHGPYSQTLQNDILALNGETEENVEFSSDAKKEISALKNAIFQEDITYDVNQWAECLGSLLYIKENLLPSSATDEDVLNEIKKRKPHLNITADNEVALQTLQNLFG